MAKITHPRAHYEAVIDRHLAALVKRNKTLAINFRLSDIRVSDKCYTAEFFAILSEKIRPLAPRIQLLDLEATRLGDEVAEKASEFIALCTNAHTVRLSHNNFSNALLPHLAKAVKHLPDMQSLYVRGNKFCGKEAGDLLGAVMDNAPKLRLLKVGQNPLGNEGFAQLAKAIISHNAIDDFSCNVCGLTEDCLPSLHHFLETHLALRSLEIGAELQNEEIKSPLLRSALFSDNKNIETLTLLTPYHYQRFLENRVTTVLKRFDPLVTQTSSMADMPYSDRAFVEMHKPLLQYKTDYSGSGERAAFMDSYRNFSEQLPAFDAEAPDLIGALFTADETGYAPLDNPAVWRQKPDILETLKAAGISLTDDVLARETAKGTSFLEAAVRAAPFSRLMQGLNIMGVSLQGKVLLQEDGSATPLYQSIMDNNDGAKLFTVKNWAGGYPEHMRQVLELLPENQRAQVANYHALRSEMQRENKNAQTVGGR